MTTDLLDRIQLHVEVTLPDWLETNPPQVELEAVIAAHVWVIAAAEQAIVMMERKLSA